MTINFPSKIDVILPVEKPAVFPLGGKGVQLLPDVPDPSVSRAHWGIILQCLSQRINVHLLAFL